MVGGRDSVRPDGEEVMGRVERSSFSRDCAPSRAAVFNMSSELEELGVLEAAESGLGSVASRWPRSKV